MAVTMTSIRLDTDLADEAVKVLKAKSRTDAVHIALREIVGLKRFKKLMKKNSGKLKFSGLDELTSSSSTHRSWWTRLRHRRHREEDRVRHGAGSGVVGGSRGIAARRQRRRRNANSSGLWRETIQVLTPTQKNWLESGEILAKIRADHGFEPHKLRDLHFDVLIALTARSHGARLVTTNRTDFELINRYRQIKLEVW